MKLQLSIFVLLILLVTASTAQIKYYPTTFWDIDEDGNQDITIKYHPESFGYFTVNTHGDLEIEFAKTGRFLNYLRYNDTINTKLNWQPQGIMLFSYHENIPREWRKYRSYFMGVRFKKNDTYYYGWFRFMPEWSCIYKDFAICSEPGKPIKAGEGMVSVTPVYDKIFNDKNKIGINVSFFPSYNRLYVSEYRLYIVKSSKIDEINIDTLLSVPESNYQVDTVAISKHSVKLSPDLPTIDNEPVYLREDYRVCILAYSADPDTFQHSFVITDIVTIDVSTVSVPTPAAFDMGDDGNNKDIQIKFGKSSNEAFVKEYKLMILPADSAETFNLVKAVAISNEFSFSVTPSNDSVYTIENVMLTDVYGNNIIQNKKYNAFVLSVHDGINSNISSLSLPSNVFVLNKVQYLFTGQTEGEEIIYVEGFCKDTLDFDNDGKADITIAGNFIEGNTRYIVDFDVLPGENVEIVHSEFDKHHNLAKNMAVNTPLFFNSHWSSDTLILADIHNYYDPQHINEYGEFEYGKEGFIGFRKIAERDTIYGWATFIYGYIGRYAIQDYSKLLFIESIDDGDFLLYPNPNSNRIITIKIKELHPGENNYIDILNSAGGVINSYRIDEKISRISIASLRRGLYFVRLRMPDKQITNKLIVL